MKKLTEMAVFTDKLDEMVAFYITFLGAQPVAQSEGMAIFMLDGVKLFLHQTYTPAEGELPPENHTAFTVPDIAQACAQLEAAGLTIEVTPKEYYWGISAYLRDPDGRLLELIQTEE